MNGYYRCSNVFLGQHISGPWAWIGCFNMAGGGFHLMQLA